MKISSPLFVFVPDTDTSHMPSFSCRALGGCRGRPVRNTQRKAPKGILNCGRTYSNDAPAVCMRMMPLAPLLLGEIMSGSIDNRKTAPSRNEASE